MSYSDKIGQNKVHVLIGDMTRTPADAMIVPQFNDECSYEGVGAAIMRIGAKAGLDAYQAIIDAEGTQPFGTARLTKSGVESPPYLLHAVSVYSGSDREMGTVQNAFYQALREAEKQGLKTISAPAMGTGILGHLSAAQSAKAMMSGLDCYSKEGGTPLEISFVIYNDVYTHREFAEVLKTKAYQSAEYEKVGGLPHFFAKFQMEEIAPGSTDPIGDKIQEVPSEKKVVRGFQKRDPLKPDGTSRGLTDKE